MTLLLWALVGILAILIGLYTAAASTALKHPQRTRRADARLVMQHIERLIIALIRRR